MSQTAVNFKIVLLDESYAYAPDFLAQCGGKIMRAYLFDALRAVHCCEITPSYELYPLDSYAAAQIADDLDETLKEMDAMTDEVIYMHCGRLDSMQARFPNLFYDYRTEVIKEDETWESVRDDHIEDAKCNERIAPSYHEPLAA